MALSNKSTVTIKDVARACGVSTQTISRVINERSEVSPATREKVLAVIRQMGYQPNAVARSMRQGSRTIGVIVTGLKYKGISTTINGIAQQAQKRGYSIIVKSLESFDSRGMTPLIQSLISHQVQGIIYAAPEVGDNWSIIQQSLEGHNLPMVFLKGNPSSAPLTASIDNYYGAYLITRHMIECGYKKIAHISGPLSWWESRERARGWRQALLDTGQSIQDEALIEGDWSTERGVEAFADLYENYKGMDAVFAANDQTALGVLSYAWENNISVPKELAVGGYDDISESRYFTPPLTTIRQNFYRLGEIGVDKLLTVGSGKKVDDPLLKEDTIILKPELIIRSST